MESDLLNHSTGAVSLSEQTPAPIANMREENTVDTSAAVETTRKPEIEVEANTNTMTGALPLPEERPEEKPEEKPAVKPELKPEGKPEQENPVLVALPVHTRPSKLTFMSMPKELKAHIISYVSGSWLCFTLFRRSRC